MSSLAQRLVILQGPSLDLDVLLWKAAVIANGGSVSPVEMQRRSRLVRGLKICGAWYRTDDYWILSAESAIQALTSLKQRRLAVVGSAAPAFIASLGYVFDGTTYLKTGFIPNTHAVLLTGSDMQLSSWEEQNVTAGKYSIGQTDATDQNTDLIPRTGGNAFLSNLNCANAVGATTVADSRGLTSGSRTGSTFGFYKNGAAIETVTPATNGTTLGTTELYIGGRNNGGSLNNGRATTVSFASAGGSLTAAQELGVYNALLAYRSALPSLDVYVSSVNFGGIPIGDDTTGLGTVAAPYETWDVAYARAPARARIFLNGDPGSPPTYKSATSTTLDKAITIQAVNALGAVLAGVGNNQALVISPTNGETIKLIDLIIDASQNTTATGANDITLNTQTTPYTLILTRCTLTGWSTSYGIANGASNCRVNLLLNSCTFTCGSTISGLHIDSLAAGGVTINGGSLTITQQTGGIGAGAIHVVAVADGVTGSATDFNLTSTLDPALVGAGAHYGMVFFNIPAKISGGTYSTLGAPGSRTALTVGYSLDATGDGLGIDLGAGYIENATVVNSTNGGIAVFISIDTSYSTKATGGHMTGCMITAGNAHATFIGNANNAYGDNNHVITGGGGLLIKWGSGCEHRNSTVDCAFSTIMTAKSAPNSKFTNNVGSMLSGSALEGITLNDAGDGTFSTNCIISGNTVILNGATNTIAVDVSVGSSGTFSNDIYNLTSGTGNASPFRYQGTTYANLAAWKAAREASASGTFP